MVNGGPLKGCKGTILAISMTATPGKPTNCSYLVALGGEYQQEPRWFESQEIALVGTTCEQPAEC